MRITRQESAELRFGAKPREWAKCRVAASCVGGLNELVGRWEFTRGQQQASRDNRVEGLLEAVACESTAWYHEEKYETNYLQPFPSSNPVCHRAASSTLWPFNEK